MRIYQIAFNNNSNNNICVHNWNEVVRVLSLSLNLWFNSARSAKPPAHSVHPSFIIHHLVLYVCASVTTVCYIQCLKLKLTGRWAQAYMSTIFIDNERRVQYIMTTTDDCSLSTNMKMVHISLSPISITRTRLTWVSAQFKL